MDAPDAGTGKRIVFVGSSHEGLNEAQTVCEALGKDPEIEARLWSAFFEAGSLTFEALEDMLLQCCGAVFVFRPDDSVRHIATQSDHPAKVLMPRGNVLLEFGLVAGRLGRHNVAVCRYGGAVLPTDLTSLTVIDMEDRKTGKEGGPAVYGAAEGAPEKLRHWASRLMATAPRIPRTAVLHGYTGEWEFQLKLSKWHSRSLNSPSYGVINGCLGLFVSADGDSGYGFAHGILSYRIEADAGPFSGDLQVVHELQSVDCSTTGGLHLLSRLIGMAQVQETGAPWPELKQFLGAEPWRFVWDLVPDGPRQMKGTVSTSASGGTEGEIVAKKKKLC